MSKISCPLCGASVYKVIYLGLPMLLCREEQCACLFGFWSWIANLLPISDGEHFAFFAYSGHYMPALWAWLTQEAS